MLSGLPSKKTESSDGREGVFPSVQGGGCSFSRKLFSFQGSVADILL